MASAAPVVLAVVVREETGEVFLERELAPASRVPAAAATAGLPPSASFDAVAGLLKLQFTLLAADRSIVDRWTETLEVPGFAPGVAALGTPSLFVARSVHEYRALVGSSGELIATPLREFRRTDRVMVHVPVHAVATSSVRAQLLNRTGAALVDLGSGNRLELPLANLAAGDYILKLQLRDHEAITQHAAFRVVP
jgi:hypothetical protein